MAVLDHQQIKEIERVLTKKSDAYAVFTALVEIMLPFRTSGPWKGISFEKSQFRLEFEAHHADVGTVAKLLSKTALNSDRVIVLVMTPGFSTMNVTIRWKKGE